MCVCVCIGFVTAGQGVRFFCLCKTNERAQRVSFTQRVNKNRTCQAITNREITSRNRTRVPLVTGRVC